MSEVTLRRAGLLLAFLGLVLIVGFVVLSVQMGDKSADGQAAAQPSPPATLTPEPIIPTATGGPVAAEPLLATPSMLPVASVSPCPLDDCRQRAGVSGQPNVAAAAQAAGLHFGTYLNWNLVLEPLRPGGAAFWQMVRLDPEGPVPSWDAIATTVAANPGAVWIVGNEPDVIWQDNLTAEQYAAHYHDVYWFIKDRDARAKVAVAGVAQPTPLRLAYLDRVLDAYKERTGDQMPVDVWTVHGFILREQAGSWGVDIPPGFDEPIGRLYEIEDHNDLTIFRQNLLDFRSWMASRGYGDRPLAMTEFGILLPADYGFPSEVVANFMIGALEILATTTGEHGYPADGQRLVQWWHWYSIYDPDHYPTGDLFDPETGTLTFLGRVYAAFIGE